LRSPSLALVILFAAAAAAEPVQNSTLLNRWPLLRAHDFATGYLKAKGEEEAIVYRWTKTGCQYNPAAQLRGEILRLAPENG